MGMLDAVTIVRTKFTNMSNGNETYGYRMYSGNGQNTYCNGLSKEDIPTDDLELLQMIKDSPVDDTCETMLDGLSELEEAIFIDEEMYSWDDIKDIIEA